VSRVKLDGGTGRWPCSAWPPEHDGDRIAVVEEDIRALLRAVAGSRQQLRARELEHAEELRRLLLELLEVLDAFERVLAPLDGKPLDAPRPGPPPKQVRAVQRLLASVLADHGVTAFQSLATTFDPHRHRAVDVADDPSGAVDAVVEERKRGYTWNGDLLRKAEVVTGVDGQRPDGRDQQ